MRPEANNLLPQKFIDLRQSSLNRFQLVERPHLGGVEDRPALARVLRHDTHEKPLLTNRTVFSINTTIPLVFVPNYELATIMTQP